MEFTVDPPELEMKKNVGRYLILYNSVKFLARIESFDRKEGTVIFRQVAGSIDNGKRYKARYDKNYCQVKVYTTKKEGMRAFKGKPLHITTKKKKKKHGRRFNVKRKTR